MADKMQFGQFLVPICNLLKSQRKSPPEWEGLRKFLLSEIFDYNLLLFLIFKF